MYILETVGETKPKGEQREKATRSCATKSIRRFNRREKYMPRHRRVEPVRSGASAHRGRGLFQSVLCSEYKPVEYDPGGRRTILLYDHHCRHSFQL